MWPGSETIEGSQRSPPWLTRCLDLEHSSIILSPAELEEWEFQSNVLENSKFGRVGFERNDLVLKKGKFASREWVTVGKMTPSCTGIQLGCFVFLQPSSDFSNHSFTH